MVWLLQQNSYHSLYHFLTIYNVVVTWRSGNVFHSLDEVTEH